LATPTAAVPAAAVVVSAIPACNCDRATVVMTAVPACNTLTLADTGHQLAAAHRRPGRADGHASGRGAGTIALGEAGACGRERQDCCESSRRAPCFQGIRSVHWMPPSSSRFCPLTNPSSSRIYPMMNPPLRFVRSITSSCGCHDRSRRCVAPRVRTISQRDFVGESSRFRRGVGRCGCAAAITSACEKGNGLLDILRCEWHQSLNIAHSSLARA